MQPRQQMRPTTPRTALDAAFACCDEEIPVLIALCDLAPCLSLRPRPGTEAKFANALRAAKETGEITKIEWHAGGGADIRLDPDSPHGREFLEVPMPRRHDAPRSR